MPAELTSSPGLSVAIVAPSLAILGGQAVQASRLIAEWEEDTYISAFLVPVNPRPPRGLRFLTRIKYVRTALTELFYIPSLVKATMNADIVHVFSASYCSFLLAPLPAVIIARLLGRPVLMNYRSGQAPDHLGRSAVARATLKAVDQNVVPSRFLHDVLLGHGIASRIIPNIVDRDRFSFRLREPLKPRLLSTRNFEALYNVECTLRAFATIQRRYPEATLTLVGGGSRDKSLHRLSAELGLRGVTFAGRVAPHEIPRYYADADIYLQTPDIDNMPGSILEAYSSGLAVVATDVGGVPAILTDGVHGLLAPADDAERVAAQVCRLLEDQPLARRLALAASQVADSLVWARVRDQWALLYRELVNRSVAVAPAVQSR